MVSAISHYPSSNSKVDSTPLGINFPNFFDNFIIKNLFRNHKRVMKRSTLLVKSVEREREGEREREREMCVVLTAECVEDCT